MSLFNSVGKSARVLGSVLLLVTFVAGALAGAAVERVLRADNVQPGAAPRGPEMRGGSRRLLQDETFARELGLTTEQRAQIKAIMDRRDEQARKVWHEAEPRLKEVGDATRDEIQKVLSTDQVQKLEAEIEKRRAAWRDRHKCHSDSTAKAMKKETDV
jgi:Spy/CpxP family protein refolding chaperone